MPEPTAFPRPSVVALAASAFVLTACQREEAPPTAQPAPPVAEAPPARPAPSPTLSRVDLLRAMELAASTYAAGEQPSGEGLAGRRFVVRQAFGCDGPSPPTAADAPGDGLGRWLWGPERKTIQVDLMPGDWTDSPLIAGGADNWEAAEGIWLSRPWLYAEGCPRAGGDPLASGPAAPSPETAGIAAVFEADGSRLGRRNGRAYSVVLRGEGDSMPAPAGGYRLVLEGRLTAYKNGRAVRCRASSPDQRPVCIAAAVVDRVAFEDSEGGVLGEWRAG